MSRRVRPGGLASVALVVAISLSAAGDSTGSGPDLPKVPFANQPCQSLSSADQATLKIPGPLTARSDRAPGTLPFDNVCTYDHGGSRYAQVGFMSKGDYEANSSGNRSTKQKP